MMLPSRARVVCAVAAAPESPVADIAMGLGIDEFVGGRAEIPAAHAHVILVADGTPAVEACDGLVAIVDGEVGLHPDVAAAWGAARDASVPRLMVTVRAAAGRADFDELVAIAQRVAEPDLAVRYLPLYADDGEHYAGRFDVLRLVVEVRGAALPADPEHLAATADAHDELVDLVAHAGLSDEALAAFTAGLPVSLPAIEEAWWDADVVKVLPGDDGLTADIVTQWVARLDPTR